MQPIERFLLLSNSGRAAVAGPRDGQIAITWMTVDFQPFDFSGVFTGTARLSSAENPYPSPAWRDFGVGTREPRQDFGRKRVEFASFRVQDVV